jgi:hypothetical protein
MKLLRSLLIFLVALPVAAQNHYYTTTFPATENPICQTGGSGCVWTNGKTDGLKWGDVQTTPGLVFGTNINGAPPFDDSTAVLKGTWTANQSVQATVKLIPNSSDSSSQEEVELHLNMSITPNSITGYELDFSVINSNPYVLIVRWNGPLNNYTSLTNLISVPIHNGDVLKGTNVDGLITIYVNGTKVLSVTDKTYSNGAPGIGFWNERGTISDLANYGFSAFTAWDSAYTGQQPSAPSGLTGTVVSK